MQQNVPRKSFSIGDLLSKAVIFLLYSLRWKITAVSGVVRQELITAAETLSFQEKE